MSILDVIVRGSSITKYEHKGNTFVEGRKDSPFIIKVSNPTYSVVKAIVSVDGLSVIDGNPAGIESQGYILEPQTSLNIQGWRTSNEEVSEFVFKNKSESLNAKTKNNTSNVGVIGVMFLPEKQVFRSPRVSIWETDYSMVNPVFGSNTSGSGIDSDTLDGQTGGYWNSRQDGVGVSHIVPLGLNSLGTGWGKELKDKAKEDNTKIFDETPSLFEVIYYDDRKGLERRGIVVDPRNEFPNPFPSYSVNNSYVKIPKR